MRPLLILTAGCLPLAVLTVASFVELGSIDEQLGAPNRPPIVEVETSSAGLAAQLSQEKPLVADLAETDLLAGETLRGLDEIGEESGLRPVQDSWPRWVRAREMIAKLLRVERRTASAVPGRLDPMPLEDLDGVASRLVDLRERCETAKREYDALRKEYQGSPGGGTAELVAIVDARIAEFDRRIQQCDQRLEAANTLSDARAAFQPGKYGDCVGLCDKLLADYASAHSPAVVSKVQILRERARFWDDAERLLARLDDTSGAERRALLENFLGKYRDRALRTEAEQRILDDCDERLRQVKGELAATAANRAAEKLIHQLDQNLPLAFDDRLRGAVRIVDRYPTDSVKMTLRGNAREWLREFLPEKLLAESPQLKEAETTRHEIVRGFFSEVVGPDGAVFGYKRYPTLEALNDPAFDVGTYRKDEFLDPPGESTPRHCVRQYNQARDRLIADPGRRAAWVELADLCESLETELREYRSKKGASQEDADLSFQQEGRFARDLLAGSDWAHMETLFGP